jgi:thioredoxin-related protein
MTRKLLILLFFLVTCLAESQNLEWKTNVVDAITLSNEERKPLLIFFTAANAPENLQNEVFKTLEFEKWSRRNVILLKLDLSDVAVSNEVKEQNIKLKNAFGVANLPEVCYTTGSIRNGKTAFNLLGRIPYSSNGVKAFISDSNLILNPE